MNITVPWIPHANSPRTAILIINSGENGNPLETEPDEFIGTLAAALGTVIAVIDQIPNQPLHFADEFGSPRKEDEILATLSWLDNLLDDRNDQVYTWCFERDGSIRVQTVTPPKQVLLWQTTNPLARDFRLETLGENWTSTELQSEGNGIYDARVEPPP